MYDLDSLKINGSEVKDALAHHYNEDDTSGPFTAAHKNVSNPNRQQNTWPLVMRTSDHWIWRSRWGELT